MPQFPVRRRQQNLPTTSGASVARQEVGTAGAAIAQLGAEVTHLAQQQALKRQRTEQVNQILTVETRLTEEAERLRTQLLTDTDREGIEQRYAEAFKKVESEALAGIQDDDVLTALRQRAAALGHVLRQAVQTRGVQLTNDAAKATLKTRHQQLLQAAAAAPDAATRDAILREGELATENLRLAGALTAEEAVATNTALRDQALEAHALGRIRHAPNQLLEELADPQGPYARLDPKRRETLIARAQARSDAEARRLEKLERDLEEARKKNEAALEDDLRARTLAPDANLGELRDEIEVLRSQRKLTGEAYRRARDLVDKRIDAGGADDPRLRESVKREILLGQVDRPTQITRHLGRGLTDTTVNELLALWQQGQGDGLSPEAKRVNDPDVAFWRQRIVEAIKTQGDLVDQLDRAAQQRQSLALDEFWRRAIVQRERPDVVARELIERYANFPALTRDQLPRPRFGSRVEMQRLYDAGLITRQDYIAGDQEFLRLERLNQAAPTSAPAGALEAEKARRNIK